jgi:hypothetical protein
MAEVSIATSVSITPSTYEISMGTFNSGFLIFRNFDAVNTDLQVVQVKFFYNAGNSEYIPIDISTVVYDPHKNDSLAVPVMGLTNSIAVQVTLYTIDGTTYTTWPISINILPSKIN